MTEDTTEPDRSDDPVATDGTRQSTDAEAASDVGDEPADAAESRTSDSEAADTGVSQTDDGPTETTGPDEQYCSSCGSIVKKAAEICPNCGVRQSGSPGGTSEKNPGAAALLSFFITGAGQIYNGQVGKGLILMVVQAVNVLLMFVLIGFLTYFVVWAFAIYDAYSVAERLNRGDTTP